ncbi:hypothetical protein PKB_2251 [Pseudomonas knackmussii B13]|uniref:DUF1722 domain-containing protein n=1 Tax=Pseudomonas knackmussii (strain DSM 6978 / CCUG 54928 / LMG 23759 / B13) TaxID=1301098 RepID=A0A024HGP9_PSEKB|nr:DUF523 and DUF1722 domain-containing protein [Pseudomonas knackmussii]CDF83598.1 hypothetical protein PKB_2251 [Pseudomonas knackmussii B13]
MPCPAPAPIRLGISACLLGKPVRFNGGHKESRLCSEMLSQHFEFVPLCPEVAIGLGTPREAIRLVGDTRAPRAVGSRRPELDVTAALDAFGERMAGELEDICGFILMQKSPSCGMERVKVYQADGHPAQAGGSGIFAAALMRCRPELPVEEDGRLNDPVLRENFLTRVYAYAQWRDLRRAGLTRKALIAFHSRYKLQLLANSPAHYRSLGRKLANLAGQDLERLADDYFAEFMRGLRVNASRGTHTNVLHHLVGYLRRRISQEERQELRHLIDQYRQGIVPLVVPLTLFKHHLRRHPGSYVDGQAYLQPHPEALSLRNAI